MFEAGSGILILSGATASGKTDLSIQLARRYNAEIVGADSRQVYRDMPIGTALPTADQRNVVPHHCVNVLHPYERYSAARFAGDALAAIDDIRSRNKRVIVVGGTGFYIRALLGGIDLAAQYDETLRRRLATEAVLHPPGFLYQWLALRDPHRAAALHPRDTYRVLRALEVVLTREVARAAPLRTLKDLRIPRMLIFLDVPLHELDARIARRTDEMLEAGFVAEAERIGEHAPASSALGYDQAFAYLRGWTTRDEMRALLERATRRYARRQRAWFRREPQTLWLQPTDVDAAVREKLVWTLNSQ